MPEVTGSIIVSCGEQAYISQTPMDLTASSPQAVGEAGALSRLPSGPHNQTEDRHSETFQQRRHPAKTGLPHPHRHDLYVSQELRRKSENRDSTVSKARDISLQEAAEQVREEDKEAQLETICPD